MLADFIVEPGFSRDEAAKRVSAQLTIADCGRIVTLDLDAGTRAEARNALHKARLLRDIVDRSVDALERAVADAGLSGERKG